MVYSGSALLDSFISAAYVSCGRAEPQHPKAMTMFCQDANRRESPQPSDARFQVTLHDARPMPEPLPDPFLFPSSIELP